MDDGVVVHGVVRPGNMCYKGFTLTEKVEPNRCLRGAVFFKGSVMWTRK